MEAAAYDGRPSSCPLDCMDALVAFGECAYNMSWKNVSVMTAYCQTLNAPNSPPPPDHTPPSPSPPPFPPETPCVLPWNPRHPLR